MNKLTSRRIRILSCLWLLSATLSGFAAPQEQLAGFQVELVNSLDNSLRIDESTVHSVAGGGASGNVAGNLPKEFHTQLVGTVTVTSYRTTDDRNRKTTELLRLFEQLWRPVGGRLLNRDYFEGEYGYYIFQLPGGTGLPPTLRLVWLQDNYYKVTVVDAQRRAPLINTETLDESIRKQGYATVFIEFENARWELKSSAMKQVDQIVTLLRLDPTLRLSVQGHTDNVGGRDDNRRLSERRAQSVAKALTNAGVHPARLKAVGFGADRPLADNASEEGRASNRRVDLVKF